MPSASMPFGRSKLTATLPEVSQWIEHRGLPPVLNESAAVEAALASPIGTKPLRDIAKPGERVAIIVNDITRLTRTDLFLPPVVQTLNEAGIPDHDIFIVFALGIHRPQTEAERIEIIGADLHRRIRNFDHNCHDDDSLVTVGVTSFGNTVRINKEVWNADRIILTGEIIYHLIAGYSGGRKSLVPGVAGASTTTFNHGMIFDPNCRSGVLDGNPAHEDLSEACRMVDPDFLVNVVLSPEGKLLRVVAGHFEKAHREGCRTVDAALSAPVDEPYDLIIASAGGYPLDIDLRQAHKGLENACAALKPGGSILFYAECPNGAGHPRFADFVWQHEDEFAMRKSLEQRFEVGGHKAFWIARLARQYRVYLVSDLDPAFTRKCGFQPVDPANHQESLNTLAASAHRIGVMPHAGHTLPVLQKSAGRQ
jgi:nickel-dependent lactate racemase